jgi:hypothetical protein
MIAKGGGVLNIEGQLAPDLAKNGSAHGLMTGLMIVGVGMQLPLAHAAALVGVNSTKKPRMLNTIKPSMPEAVRNLGRSVIGALRNEGEK